MPADILQDKQNGKDIPSKRSLKDLINTPLKKAMFMVQILSYILILGSPVIGAALGRLLGTSTAKTAGLILGVFIAGEILFYGSLAFLGKELILLLKDKLKIRSKGKKRRSSEQMEQ